MKETGAHAVKMEGGEEVIDGIVRIVSSGVPVMGHLGLTPQSIYKFGTYQVRAKEEAEAEKLRTDAKKLQEAGCFAIVLEKIPAVLAKEVSESLSIPTIGIGAGKFCDQVLVMHDMPESTMSSNPVSSAMIFIYHDRCCSALYQRRESKGFSKRPGTVLRKRERGIEV
jgi:3-methyl-2-oxobutanoate hydroxymethyltransferase